MRNDRTLHCASSALGALLAVGCGERTEAGTRRRRRHHPRPLPTPTSPTRTRTTSRSSTPTTTRSIGTIPVGTRPRGVKVSQDGKFVFVALSGSPKCPPSMPDAECEKLGSDKTKDGVAVVDAPRVR